jgi:hypothetical protein
MSTVVWLKNIRIEIRSREKNHIGRPHCHAVGRGGDASIDLVSLEVLESQGFSRSDIKQILSKINEYREELMAKWEEYHGQEENKLCKKERS